MFMNVLAFEDDANHVVLKREIKTVSWRGTKFQKDEASFALLWKSKNLQVCFISQNTLLADGNFVTVRS
jgi:hypothetical protein